MKIAEFNANGAVLNPSLWDRAWGLVKPFAPQKIVMRRAFFWAGVFTAYQPEPNYQGLYMLEFWRSYPKAKPRLMVRLRNLRADEPMLKWLKEFRKPHVKSFPVKQ